jgi:hypothetical protein
VQALFEAGAGNIGNYEDCSFSSKGIGTYMGNENSDPQLGARLNLWKPLKLRSKHSKNI